MYVYLCVYIVLSLEDGTEAQFPDNDERRMPARFKKEAVAEPREVKVGKI